ncbi:MAG: phage major capsid protein [Pseudomonadota bacterium]
MLTPDQVDDFVQLTLPHFKRYKWTDISVDLQDYVTARIIQSKGVKEQGGSKLSWTVKVKNTGNARNTGLYAQDITKVEDVTITAEVPWVKQTTNFSYDIDEELFQSDRETIIDVLKIRDHDAMTSLAELHEENFWSAPTDAKDQRPNGVPFWFKKDPTTTPEGAFNGGNPSGFAGGAAGIDSTVYTNWRNYTFGYSAVSTPDLVKKMKLAKARTRFKAPVPHPELGYGKVDYEILTTLRVTEPLERLAETRNDKLGADVAMYIDKVTVGGTPVSWVPYLEANDTSDPVYGICWKDFRPFCKKGAQNRRTRPQKSANQHTVREVHIDNWMNYEMLNRRSGWVGSKG